jgi:uncharacterized protein YecT (DUF1311 family)
MARNIGNGNTPLPRMYVRWRGVMTYLIAMVLLPPLLSIAQQSESYRACNQKAKNQLEMNRCASDEATRAEKELNALYSELLSSASAQADAIAKIEASEKAWTTYRDSYIDAMYPAPDKRAEYGSIFPMEADLLRAKLIRQHIADLKQLLRQYKNGSE